MSYVFISHNHVYIMLVVVLNSCFSLPSHTNTQTFNSNIIGRAVTLAVIFMYRSVQTFLHAVHFTVISFICMRLVFSNLTTARAFDWHFCISPVGYLIVEKLYTCDFLQTSVVIFSIAGLISLKLAR